MRTQRKITFLTLCTLFILCALCGLVLTELEWPLKEKTYLTGTFGEFRKNHIHAGIDISTNGKIGLPVYASESGLLHRIKTQYKGFGKAVYIKLNDGKFVVYAHLDRFSPDIEKILKEEQKKNEKYAVDISPKEKIYINKDELIGYSGDTGGVSPHLHLELRDNQERPINPVRGFASNGVNILKHGLNIKDDISPHITGLAICNPLNTYCVSFYSAENIPPLIQINGKAGLAVSVYDPSYGNKLGIYKIELIIDGKEFFIVRMDTFSYNEFYDNFLLCNKDLYVNKNKIYYHLFRAFNNKLPFYKMDSDGILDLPPGEHSVIINAFDYSGNKDTLSFKVISTPAITRKEEKIKKCIWSSEDNLFSISIEKEDLYYPIQAEIDTIIPRKTTGELIPVSNTYRVRPSSAVFKKAKISIRKPENLDRVGLYKYEDRKWKLMDDENTRDFTKFALFRDITPPSIEIISTYPTFRAKIDDKGSGLDYDKTSLYIDGEKVIAEYSVNRKELFCEMSGERCKTLCTASDRVGNISKKEASF